MCTGMINVNKNCRYYELGSLKAELKPCFLRLDGISEIGAKVYIQIGISM